jgi:hypothetical protein
MMSVSINPISFNPNYDNALKNMETRVENPFDKDMIEKVKKQAMEYDFSGSVYESEQVSFRKLSLKELEREKIEVKLPTRTYKTYTDGTKDSQSNIAIFRDPKDKSKYTAVELSPKTISKLKEKFDGENQFFDKGDGIIRLNGEAEEFVASWHHDIEHKRNYGNADKDGNGIIQNDEVQDLKIATERFANYDYIGRKAFFTNIGLEATYQKLDLLEKSSEELLDSRGSEKNRIYSEYSKFENTIDKELDHTINMDEDFDGTVSLEESLKDEFGEEYKKKIEQDIQKYHNNFLDDNPEYDNEAKIRQNNTGKHEILSEEERELIKEQFMKAKDTSQEIESKMMQQTFSRYLPV